MAVLTIRMSSHVGATAGVTVLRRALQRQAPLPLYVQIRDRFVVDIQQGRIRPGEQLPSEPELAAMLGVGRPTVRQAIALLRQEGWVVTRRGAGTFAMGASPRVSLMGFDGLTHSLQERGFSVHDEVLGYGDADRPPLEVLDLGAENGPWWTVERLRRVDDGTGVAPFCVESDSFNLTSCPDAEELFLSSGSAAAVLEASYGYGVSSCEVATRAVSADTRSARLLGVRARHPLLAMERLNRGADGTEVHAVSFLLRTDQIPIFESIVNPAGSR